MPKLSRQEVYELIDSDRDHQDTKWRQIGSPPPPSDELRVIKRLLQLADEKWYLKPDELVNGVRVNPADLEAARKIAAVCVRLMENFGAPARELPTKIKPITPSED